MIDSRFTSKDSVIVEWRKPVARPTIHAVFVRSPMTPWIDNCCINYTSYHLLSMVKHTYSLQVNDPIHLKSVALCNILRFSKKLISMSNQPGKNKSQDSLRWFRSCVCWMNGLYDGVHATIKFLFSKPTMSVLNLPCDRKNHLR